MPEQQQFMDALHIALRGSSATPLYRRLERGIRNAVNKGILGADDALPSERNLATKLGVSRITVRRAVRSLVDEGLLNQQQGAGTFVSSLLEQPLTSLTSFSEDMMARGLVPGVRWLDRSTGTATPDEVVALGLQQGSKVTRLYRLRTASDRILCLEHATLPFQYLPDPESVEVSLYALLAERGIHPIRARQTLRAELFNIEQARLLAVPPGSASLYIERHSFLPDGTPVEFVTSHYRGDSYSFVVDLQLDATNRTRHDN